MPTPNERRALMFLSTLLLLGFGFRAGAALHSRPAAQSTAALDHQLLLVDSARAQQPHHRATKKRRAARAEAPTVAPGSAVAATDPAARPSIYYAPPPPSPASRIDVDRATAAEIDRLPRVGPVLAARIIADRDSLGPFGSLEGLTRVKGIGPALARRLAPYVTFSGTPRPSRVDDRGGRAPAKRARGRPRRPSSP